MKSQEPLEPLEPLKPLERFELKKIGANKNEGSVLPKLTAYEKNCKSVSSGDFQDIKFRQ